MNAAYRVSIPKMATTELDALRKQVDKLAARYGSNHQLWWWADRTDEIVFCFENGSVAVLFTMYCTNQGIRFRVEWPKNSEMSGPNKL